MANYIELTKELELSMRAGAYAILNASKYDGSIFFANLLSGKPDKIPFLKAAIVLTDAANQSAMEDQTIEGGGGA